ncbi:hydroxymethylglutaryl-CoA synthase [Pokkaliibacter sp. CJK22405]|uniref:hydroxymethylglutaryl-CoA synthase n=1 Tax=Pokkaliibacter sp. CJK22405 TaxID=3384615 RepID=UPI0039847D60
MKVGIEDICFYTANYVLDMAVLADVHGIEVEKFYQGIGQVEMSMAAPDEDIVTLAAAAAKPIVENHDMSQLRTVLVATESGIDQSKSAGVYVHNLLGLPSHCRVLEMKQACYSATSALQMACSLVARQPEQKVLVIATDIARYDLNSSGEPTQGCGAVAMLVGANPKLLEIEPVSGLFCEDVMDFWRPNYRSTALVDGKYSTKVYLRSLKQAWQDYQEQGGHSADTFSYFCYHQPFTRMAQKAHTHWLKQVKKELSAEAIEQQLEPSLVYNRRIGNSYTASMYIGLASLLDNTQENLDNKRIGLFSYGSGCVAEWFAAKVQPGYREYLRTAYHQQLLESRTAIDYPTYRRLYEFPNPTDGGDHQNPHETTGPFRLSAISQHKRLYEKTSS